MENEKREEELEQTEEKVEIDNNNSLEGIDPIFSNDGKTVKYDLSTGKTYGKTGKEVKSITTQYYLSSSKTTQTGGSWVTTCPAWVSGKYLWIRKSKIS